MYGSKPQHPAFSVGQPKDDLTVIKYYGHSDIKPESDPPQKMSGAMHWYRTECKCGEQEVVSQHSLRNKKCCVLCSRIPKPIRIRNKQQLDIPNFATMRLRGTA